MKRVVYLLPVVLVSLVAVTHVVWADSDTCVVTGDINGNSIGYELADLVMLTQFVVGEGPSPVPLYEGDINGDGYIDYGDVAYMDSVVQGLAILPDPNPVDCDPDTLRGACVIWDTCLFFSAANCQVLHGAYIGDGMPCGEYCFADGDLNANGIAYEIADRVFLAQFVVRDGPPPDPLYAGDLNADGYIDMGDVAYIDSVINGDLYPLPLIFTVCDPDTNRGACWEYDSCVIRSAANCAAFGDVYAGDGTSCVGPCFATGDLNRNGLEFEVSDWVILTNFVFGYGPPPNPLYEGDLNADGSIDEADVAYIDSVIQGYLPPPPDPVPTGCHPDTVRGACHEGDTCFIRSAANCAAAGGAYGGDGTPCFCRTDGDINDNGIAFEIADWVDLFNFVHGWGPLPRAPLHECDVNGDGFIDDLDVGYIWKVIEGDIAPPDVPLTVNCDPDTIRGGCQMGDTCLVLAPSNCAAVGGIYKEDGIYCYCFAHGDINGDGRVLTIADLVSLVRFVYYGGPPPNPLYRGDLNTDGSIDGDDCTFLDSLITYESGTGWYTPTDCYPPDTARGGCTDGDSCTVRSGENCAVHGGTYLGAGVFCTCDCAGLGDVDLDGSINPLDVTLLANYVYKGWDAREQLLLCYTENGDWDCNKIITPVDVVFCVQYVYRSSGSWPCDPCGE